MTISPTVLTRAAGVAAVAAGLMQASKKDVLMPLTKHFLRAGVAAPLLYFATLIFGALFYPGYSHIAQFASELGGLNAPYPAIFNVGAIATGVATISAGAGLFLAITRLTGKTVLASLAGLVVALVGVSLIIAGFFPLPDERHNAFYLGLAVYAGPPLVALTLGRRKEWRTLVLFLMVNELLMLAILAVIVGAGGLATPATVGLWQRLWLLTTLLWIAVTCYSFSRALSYYPRSTTPRYRQLCPHQAKNASDLFILTSVPASAQEPSSLAISAPSRRAEAGF